jgi:hypothetical protein
MTPPLPFRFAAAALFLALGLSVALLPGALAAEGVEEVEMSGYLLVPHEKVDERFDAGFSMYVAAWPLVREYPGNRFQTGLFGTWMFAKQEEPKPKNIYSDIEGGLGWWRDTRFATETPKFIMGGVTLEFDEWANGPGAGKSRDWNAPLGVYGVAQLSPRIVWPADGLNLAQGTCGELFGYGYLPLPLTDPKSTTAGKPIPTGNQSWTLFVSAANFKGPIAFFLPSYWSRATLDKPEHAGRFLDARPAEPNKAVQMETQYVPAVQAVDAKGETWARIAPTSFPRNADNESAVIHQITAYDKTALWDSVAAWFDGGDPASGTIDPAGSALHRFTGGGGSTWRIYAPDARREEKVALAWNSFATPIALDEHTYGYRWNAATVTETDSFSGPLATLPEYYRLVKGEEKSEWVVVAADEVPAETKLADVEFHTPPAPPAEPYVTPDNPDSLWKTPGPVAGPFETRLGDGSIVTYAWYRFVDQPAIRNANLSDDERARLQARVEKLHRHWPIDRDYLPPPSRGKLASLDPALIVTPPPGLEAGYVPIAIRQEEAE